METLLEVQRTTGITPKALRDRPALKTSNRHLLEAFYEVSAGRSIGEVPQPVTTSDILAYCKLFGVHSLEDRERFFRVIRKLDSVFLLHMAKKAAAK